MSKTREVEVWVRAAEDIPSFGSSDGLLYEVFTSIHAKGAHLKAKLIIEIPERKIELTESQFDEAVKETDKWFRASTGDSRWVDDLKQQLFGEPVN